jgi:hypothetical protein
VGETIAWNSEEDGSGSGAFGWPRGTGENESLKTPNGRAITRGVIAPAANGGGVEVQLLEVQFEAELYFSARVGGLDDAEGS